MLSASSAAGASLDRGLASPIGPALFQPLVDHRKHNKRECGRANEHAAQSGVPIPRIQKLLGHATVAMAMRCMKHAPEAYFAEDAAKVASSLTGERDREKEARVELARARVTGV